MNADRQIHPDPSTTQGEPMTKNLTLPEPPEPGKVVVMTPVGKVWRYSDSGSEWWRINDGSTADWTKLLLDGPLLVLARPEYWRAHPEFGAATTEYYGR